METRTFTYKIIEDNKLHADLHWQRGSPTTKDGKGHPIVLILHGGGLVLGSKEIVPRPQIAYLTKAGFLVVVPNYRLCPQVSAFEGPITDSRDCLIWAKENADALLRHDAGWAGYQVNNEKVAVMGHSAGGGLALSIASLSTPQAPVAAVLDFYGSKYLQDPSYHAPHPLYANVPETWDEDYMNQVFLGPQVSSASPYLGNEMPPSRDAWLRTHLKRGTWITAVVKDGHIDRIDGSTGFSRDYPPTMFIHGTSDTFTSHSFSERAYSELRELGVNAELLLVPGKDHMFDMVLNEEDADFRDFVVPGLRFLMANTGLPLRE